MQIGMIGLGKMGGNMSRRLSRNGHEVVGFDLDPTAAEALKGQRFEAASSLEHLVSALPSPRVCWMMVPAGDPVDATLDVLLPLLDEADIVVDGGNSNYKDTLRRADRARDADLHYVDVGTSGGVWGLEEGYSLMVGGPETAVNRLQPALDALAPDTDDGPGWKHMGAVGAGHFVKMVHNGIEYGVMQAYAEGFAILQAKEDFDLDLQEVAETWRHGSVIRSWLLDLTARALDEDQDLPDIAPWVDDSGEGRWAVKEAIDLDVPAPVITDALISRLESRVDSSYAHKLLAALRNQFGGHAVKSDEK